MKENNRRVRQGISHQCVTCKQTLALKLRAHHHSSSPDLYHNLSESDDLQYKSKELKQAISSHSEGWRNVRESLAIRGRISRERTMLLDSRPSGSATPCLASLAFLENYQGYMLGVPYLTCGSTVQFRQRVCERERESVCVRERKRVCVRERECLCV